MRLIADDTWRGLEPYLQRPSRKRAAISYIGPAARDLLDLRAGDVIVVDGSDTALRAGQVDPEVISAWLDGGVEVRVLPGLHAKTICLEGRRTLAVVGSANASARSRDYLREAAVVTDDDGLCAQVIEQLGVWQAASDRVDDRWLRRARKIYRPPAALPTPRPRSRLGRLWIGQALNETVPLSREAAAAAERLMQRHGRGMVLSWQLDHGDQRVVRQGDEVVLVDVGPVRRKPQRNSRAWPPAVVASVVTERRRKPVAILVWLQAPEEVEPRPYEQIEQAVHAVGGEIDQERPFPPQSPEATAVRALWPTQAAVPTSDEATSASLEEHDAAG